MKFLFEMYKNKPFKSKGHLREILAEYNLTEDEFQRLYVQIYNYQIKTYGSSLQNTLRDKDYDVTMLNKARSRRQYNNRSRGFKTRNSKESRWSE